MTALYRLLKTSHGILGAVPTSQLANIFCRSATDYLMDHKALLSIALVGALTLAQEQPANCPAGCEPTACPYPDRKSILNHITSDPQNSDGSSLPKLCNICEAVYGSGNPDISGIGVS